MTNAMRWAFLVVVLAATAAQAVTFDRELVLAEADRSPNARMRIEATAADTADIVWQGEGAGMRYTQVNLAAEPGKELVISDEPVCGMTHRIAGISRDKGVIRIGSNNGKRLWQWTRGEDGKWTHVDSGVRSIQYYGAVTGWDVDPTTGLGGFLTVDDKSQTVCALEQADGTWKTQVLATDQSQTSRGDFCFTPQGKPAVVYQVIANPEKAQPGAIIAGPATRPTQVLGESYIYFPIAIAADGEGRLHVGGPLHTGKTIYAKGEGDPVEWDCQVLPKEVADGGNYGDSVDADLAVSEDGQQIALTYIGRDGKVELVSSADGGKTWSKAAVEGTGPQFPAVTIDSKGRVLLVCLLGKGDTRKLVLKVGHFEKAVAN